MLLNSYFKFICRSSVHCQQDRKSPDVSDEYKGNGKYEPLKEQKAETGMPENTAPPEKTVPPPFITAGHVKGFPKGCQIK